MNVGDHVVTVSLDDDIPFHTKGVVERADGNSVYVRFTNTPFNFNNGERCTIRSWWFNKYQLELDEEHVELVAVSDNVSETVPEADDAADVVAVDYETTGTLDELVSTDFAFRPYDRALTQETRARPTSRPSLAAIRASQAGYNDPQLASYAHAYLTNRIDEYNRRRSQELQTEAEPSVEAAVSDPGEAQPSSYR